MPETGATWPAPKPQAARDARTSRGAELAAALLREARAALGRDEKAARAGAEVATGREGRGLGVARHNAKLPPPPPARAPPRRLHRKAAEAR
jgi:hypothetical protein